MKKTNILYWTFTALFSAAMLFSAIGDVMNQADAIDFMHNKLQYPMYFIPFIGWIKVIGCVALLIPMHRRLKEWVYAGMAFDLIGAVYSCTAALGFQPSMLAMSIWFGLGIASYYFFNKKYYLTN